MITLRLKVNVRVKVKEYHINSLRWYGNNTILLNGKIKGRKIKTV